MAENETNQIRIGFGGKYLAARGGVVITVILTALTIGAVYWAVQGHDQATERRVQRSIDQHDAIIRELRVQTCIRSLTTEELKQMREQATRSGGARGVDILRDWCPWLLESDIDGRRR